MYSFIYSFGHANYWVRSMSAHSTDYGYLPKFNSISKKFMKFKKFLYTFPCTVLYVPSKGFIKIPCCLTGIVVRNYQEEVEIHHQYLSIYLL